MKINGNILKITDEFQRAGIIPFPILFNDDGTGEFTFSEGTDMQLVQEIVDSHDATPLPPIPSKEEILQQELSNTNAMILELTELILGGM